MFNVLSCASAFSLISGVLTPPGTTKPIFGFIVASFL
jgi:hypothetical protein